MKPARKPSYKPEELISKSRAFGATIMTVLGLLALIALFIHAKAAKRIVLERAYGNLLTNLLIGPGLLILHAGLSYRLLRYLNLKFVDSRIDEDHIKYI